MRVDLQSGAVQPTSLVLDAGAGWIDVSPDGSRLAFTQGSDIREVRVLENVLSALN